MTFNTFCVNYWRYYLFKNLNTITKSGRPGPVLIDITKDAQFEILKTFEYKKCKQIRSYFSVPTMDNKSLNKKDDFEFLKFNNIGQVYNKLSYNPNNQAKLISIFI